MLLNSSYFLIVAPIFPKPKWTNVDHVERDCRNCRSARNRMRAYLPGCFGGWQQQRVSKFTLSSEEHAFLPRLARAWAEFMQGPSFINLHNLGPLHTQDWRPMTIAIYELSLVERAETVQLHTRRWRHEGSKKTSWMKSLEHGVLHGV